MVDMARWLLVEIPGVKPKGVVVIGRHGPFEVEFDAKEFDHEEMLAANETEKGSGWQRPKAAV
jgi:hypothetical protein